MNDSQRTAESNVLTGPDDPINGPAKRFLKRVIERRVQFVLPLPKIEPQLHRAICGLTGQGESGAVPAKPGRIQAPGVRGATEGLSREPPAMFTKPSLATGDAGPTRFDPENDPDLYCEGKAEA